MTKSEEIYIRSRLAYLKGKVEVYENLLYSHNVLKRPELFNFDKLGVKDETTK